MRRASLFVVGVILCFGCRDRAPRRAPIARAHASARLVAHAAARNAPRASGHASGDVHSIPGDALPARRTLYIPPACYTRTQDDGDRRVHNACASCHVDALAPNYIHDGEFQLSYDFGPAARTNPWSNLFVDRRAQIAAVPDDAITAYVRQDNYRALAPRLAHVPAAWDSDGDGQWSGWRPDIAFQFDDRGFDHDSTGALTGWRAYAYYPTPAGWPTNGSYGDAMIRLSALYREDTAGRADLAVYATNLAILEAMVRRADVAIDPTDERAMAVDLDGDGQLATARRVRYRWTVPGGAAPKIANLTWAGRAGELQRTGRPDAPRIAPSLFPAGTELAHSVRYLDVSGPRVAIAARMKELRYMVKPTWMPYGALEQAAVDEAIEKQRSPDKTRALLGSTERGIANRAGWRLQAFIEDAAGDLRPQTLAEHTYCIGCHSGIGATDDSTFSFARKLPATSPQRGWFHPSQRDLAGLAEPRRADGRGDYAQYLLDTGAGDDLRTNDELLVRLFDARGALRPAPLARAQRDIASLILPSPARALALDKAYRTIVLAQSYLAGRDATIAPAAHMHRTLPDEPLATGVTAPVRDRRRAR